MDEHHVTLPIAARRIKCNIAKPYRRALTEIWGAECIASPSNQTEAGRRILTENPNLIGSLGMAISEAVEDAAGREDTEYPLGSGMNHVLMHPTIIGEEALEQAFTRDIEDGTVEVRRAGSAAVVDGGNWTLTVPTSGPVGFDLPMNDPNYYDDDTDAFIENVLNLEVEQSLAVADRELDGALSAGLREAGDVWSIRLGERLTEARV